MNTPLIQGDPECRYKAVIARVAPSVDPDAAIDVACFMSTDTVDADDEVLLPDGVDLSRFERNPVVLLCHAYGQPGTYYPLPVGKVEWTKKRPRGVLAGVRFTLKTPMGREVKALFDDDMLRSFSVGFKPIETSPMTSDEAYSRPDWRAAFERTRGRVMVHRKWHLLELSVAPVPSNPDALVTHYKSKGVAPPEWLQLPPTTEALMSDPAAKGVSGYHRSPRVDAGWDAAAAVRSVRLWASSDGSGSEDSIAWDRYAQAFLWFDEANPQTFTSYKLPIKHAEGGRLVVVEQALRAAAEALGQGASGLEIPESDLDAVRLVLSRYEEAVRTGEGNEVEQTSPTIPTRAELQGKVENDRGGDDEPLPSPPIRVGDHVRIAAPHLTGVGVVKSLHDHDLVPDVPNDILGTSDDPAARVQCYKSMDGGHVATSHHVGIHCKHLEPIAPLASPGRSVTNGPIRNRSFPPAGVLPPLVALDEQQVLEGAIAKLDRLLRPESIREMVAVELDRRMGCL